MVLAKLFDALGDAAAIVEGAGGDAAEVGLHGVTGIRACLACRGRSGRLMALVAEATAQVIVQAVVERVLASGGHRARRRDLMSGYADQTLDTSEMRVCAQDPVMLCEAHSGRLGLSGGLGSFLIRFLGGLLGLLLGPFGRLFGGFGPVAFRLGGEFGLFLFFLEVIGVIAEIGH